MAAQGAQFSSSLCVSCWLPQHSANSVLDCEYSWSTWVKEATFALTCQRHASFDSGDIRLRPST